jgi:hypothetical protein
MGHCPTGGDTRKLVEIIRQRIPDLRIELIDLDDPGAQVPPEVFSIPTYLLNDDVISLGNPSIEQLEASVRRYAVG